MGATATYVVLMAICELGLSNYVSKLVCRYFERGMSYIEQPFVRDTRRILT